MGRPAWCRIVERLNAQQVEWGNAFEDPLWLYPQNAVWSAKTNEYKLREGHIARVYQMAEAAYGGQYKNKDGKSTTYNEEKKERQIQEVVAWTIECVARNDIITIFDIRRYY